MAKPSDNNTSDTVPKPKASVHKESVGGWDGGCDTHVFGSIPKEYVERVLAGVLVSVWDCVIE